MAPAILSLAMRRIAAAASVAERPKGLPMASLRIASMSALRRVIDGGEAVGGQPAEEQIGIGDGGLASAPAIGDGAGIGTGAFGADPEQPRLVDPGDRAAASAQGVDVDHGHVSGMA